MHDEIGAVIERALQIGGDEGRIDHQRQPVVMGDGGEGRKIGHFQSRIAQAFGEDEPRLRPDRPGEGARVARIDETGGDAKARQGQLQQVDRAAIKRIRRHDMSAGAHQRRDREVEGGLTACRAEGTHAAFEGGQTLLQHRDGRIGDAAVDMAGLLEIEQ
jgi:hypothetical protein